MRSFSRVILAAGSALLLAGCGVGGSSGGDDSKDASAAEGKVTGDISFQTWNLKARYSGYFKDAIKEFEKKHPGTHIKWIDQPATGYAEKLSADASGGSLPDVVGLDRGTGSPLADAGQLVNLDKADPKAGARYEKAAWQGNDWKDVGGHFAYPWYLTTGPSLFNTALFKKAGLDPKDLPTTQDELFDQAMKMAKKSHGDFAMLGTLPGTEEMAKSGIQVMNKDQTKYTFNTPDAVKFVERYAKLYKAGGILREALTSDYVGEGKNFQSGRLAFMNGGLPAVNEAKNNAPAVYKNLAYTKQIANEAPAMYSQSLAVSKTSKNKATAIAFAKFVTDDGNQLKFAKLAGALPSSAGTLDNKYFHTSDGSDDAKIRNMSAAQVPKAQVYSWPGTTEAQKTEIREQIAQAVLGKKPVKKALDDAVAFSNQQMKKG